MAMHRRLLPKIEESVSLQLLILGMVTALAAALRFYKLGAWSFWGDEWITVQRATADYIGIVDLPPLSLIVTHYMLDGFGISEWSARLAPALIGLLTIPVLFLLVRAMFDPVVALVASLLLAISPWHIYWSQNARFYTALLLFFTLALFFFYVGLERDRPLFLIVSLFFLGLAIKERNLAAFLGPVAFLYVLSIVVLRFERPAGLRPRNLLLFFGPGIVAGAWLGYSALVVNADRWQTAFSFINNNPAWILGGVIFYLTIPLVCAGAFSSFHLLRTKDRAGLLVTLGVLVPLLSVLALSMIQYTANRYVFVSLTSIIILAAFAIKELLERTPTESSLVLYGVVLILFVAPMADNFLYYQYQNGNRDDWRSAFGFIEAEAAPGDRVVTTHSALGTFYLGAGAMSMQYWDKRFEELMAADERTWFLIDLTAPAAAPNITRWVERNARLVATYDVAVDARTFPMRVYVAEGGGSDVDSATSALR